MCVCMYMWMEIWNWVILGIISMENAYQYFRHKLLTVIAQIISRFPIVLILSSNTSSTPLLFLSNRTLITFPEQYSGRQAAAIRIKIRPYQII